TLPAVLNAANETVVYAFLDGRLDFPGIAAVIADTLERHDLISGPTLMDIRAGDRWARETAAALVARRSI
ncbi:MAG: 1-deoxy-D-xylulose-5-phosphate reductoisomerase, partial [Desulfobacterales bacterium]